MSRISDSKKNMLARAALPRDRQETLMPCPACEGTGQKTVEIDYKYKMLPCRWCDGRGAVPRSVFAVFERWQRIRLVNRLTGRCM
jgi:DnaJ-class molecular chaperone